MWPRDTAYMELHSLPIRPWCAAYLPFELEDMPLLVPGLSPLNFPDLPTFLKKPDGHPALNQILTWTRLIGSL
ncbi:hypothetical protein ACE6H2_002153 [Prunus campanulata]